VAAGWLEIKVELDALNILGQHQRLYPTVVLRTTVANASVNGCGRIPFLGIRLFGGENTGIHRAGNALQVVDAIPASPNVWLRQVEEPTRSR
jgi:hypothetical protein